MGGVPKSPWRRAADDLLADGQWHHIESAMSVGMLAVPASRAIRKRRQSRDECCPGAERLPIDVEDEFRIGARKIVSQAIYNAIACGVYERYGDRIRLTPTNPQAKETT